MKDERRTRRRVDLGSALMVRIGDTVWDADCLNASMGGAFLRVHPREPLDVVALLGRSGSLGLEHASGSDTLVIDAAFIVVRAESTGPYPKPFLLGVRFRDLDMETSLRLFTLIRWQEEV
jgi:hypothetical protein